MQLKKQTLYLVLSTLIGVLTSLTSRAQSQADITSWPKVELHLHMDCSLSYQVVHQLDAAITPEQYRQQFIAPPVCTNLADYITRADRAVDLMQTQKALRLVTLDMFDQLKRDHVIYAEIRFAPLKHLKQGLTAEQVVAAVDSAVDEGIRKTGIQVGVILCTLRHFNSEQSMQTVRLAEKFRSSHIVGFDIAGNEAGYPIDEHIAAFRYANDHGIPCTAHAGEAKGPNSVRETLNNFHPTRIGHGVRSIEDTALVRHLREKDILLEVCPSSNLQTNMYPDLVHHPVDRLYDAKVPLNISTDCRTISNITLSKEYAQLIKQFHWKKGDFRACNLEAIDHAFTTQEIKERLKTQLREAYSR
ncbi:MAG: adenosine deaminase [Sphingobacteriales bacterium]|nr:adenosine deaminase [Sphingobacteriales bacterium]